VFFIAFLPNIPSLPRRCDPFHVVSAMTDTFYQIEGSPASVAPSRSNITLPFQAQTHRV
jgi:hypothetical protein